MTADGKKRLSQGPAEPVYLWDGENKGLFGTAANPLYVQVAADSSADDHTMLFRQGTAATLGDNTIVPAPGAGFRIVVTGFVLENASATATTMILKDGPNPAAGRFRRLGQNQGDGLSKDFHPDHVWRLTAGNALVLNLSGANTCGYVVQYYTEAV